MIIQHQTFATASIPERKDVTEDLERRYKLQEEAKAEVRRIKQLAQELAAQSSPNTAAEPQPTR